MKFICLVFFAFFTAVFLAVNVYAVNVSHYNIFESALTSGNDVTVTNGAIIKSTTNAVTINIPAVVALLINGNGNVIDMNGMGNMISISNANTVVTLASAGIFRGNYTGSGGVVRISGSNSRLNVNDIVSFNGSFASTDGGAIAASNGSSVVFTGNTTFSGNRANDNGGAVSLSGNASADFSQTALYASGNGSVRGNGGFMSAVSAGQISFGTAAFTGNTAVSTAAVSGYGGAIYASGNSTIIDFGGDVSFLNNSAYSAGALYATNAASVIFSGRNTLFLGNQSSDAVGALLVRNGASVVFQGETTVFKNNFMTADRFGTGAVDIAYNASGDFTATNLIAQGNNAGYGGLGGFLWTDSSVVLFGDVLVGGEFSGEGNIAYYGGGVFSGNNSTMTFSGTTTAFRGNMAYIDGGALYVTTNSAVRFNTGSSTMTVFLNNSALNTGGAAAVKNGSILSFQGAGTSFYDNSARFGGAISIENGGTVEITNGNFTRNSASAEGGAVYLRGTDTSFSIFRSYTTAAGDGRTVFRGNEAGGVRNAIYLDDYGRAYFNTAAGTSVEMLDSISGSANTTTYFEVSGAGDFNLYGAFDIIDLNSFGKFNLMAGSIMNANTVNNAAGARFGMENGIADTARMRTLNNSGTIAMDIISPRENDHIIVSQMNLNGASGALEVKADNMTDENFRKRIYKLINYDAYTGDFASLSLLTPITLTNNPELFYGDDYVNWLTLSIRGSRSATEFKNINLDSFNQKEAAKALDKISQTVVDHSPWDLVLADIEAYDNDGIKKILSHLAGYFLPNIIRNAAADSANNEIYDRIKNHCVEGHTISSGFWVQARGGIETFYENENSIGDYKAASAGLMAGYDRFMEERSLLLGIYARYNGDSIEQGKNEAAGKRTGAGVYGGYIKKDWELKALALGSFDSFETKRYIPYANAAAEADIKTMTLSFDAEAALKFDMTLYTKFRPYAGFEFAGTNYAGFKEKGAGLFNLNVEAGSYLRTSARAGAGFLYEKDIWNWYANLEAKYLFSGTEPEIDNVFEGTEASFKTRGTKEGAFEIGGGLGGALRLTKSLKVFANANYYGADKYRNIYGNIGLRYTFCKTFSLKDYTPVYDPSLYEPEPVQPEPAAALRSEDIDMFDERVVEEQKLEAQKRREKPMLKSYSLNMASFDVNKSDLKPAAKEDIAREADEIKQFDFKRIIIEGHTDSTGSDKLNKELSKARAKAVFDEFALHGIAEDKMFYIGFGPAMPRDTNTTSEGRARNRRVEIFVE
jgi:outer membrane protein OmpA-like peptidoglycan-associated protein